MKQGPGSSVDVLLDKVDRTFSVGGDGSGGVVVTGRVVIFTPHATMSFHGIQMRVEGTARLKVSTQKAGLLEALYASMEPVEVFSCEVEVPVASNKVNAGKTEFPFRFTLGMVDQRRMASGLNSNSASAATLENRTQSRGNGKQFVETYHGVYVNVSYLIIVDVPRGMLSTTLHKETEFVVHVPSAITALAKDSSSFLISDSLVEKSYVERTLSQKLPPFSVSGRLDKTNCEITEPLTGEIIVNNSDSPIKSIEIQLVRIETVTLSDEVSKEATEIQSVQIAEGDVSRGLAIPIFVIFPRLFMCPTIITKEFRIEFEVNIIIYFAGGYCATENFPIFIYRTQA